MTTHWFTYPNIDPVAFRLGPLAVHWYGLSYLFGFICVFLWMNRPAGRRRMGLTTDQIQDFLIYALVGVLIGGRLLFVVADVITKHNFAEYLAQPLDFIAIWKGGMAFHGALVGVIVAIFIFLRKHPGLTFNVLADEVVVLLPLAIATTRVVNFINDELWGKLCDPDQPYCIKFPAAPDGYRHPSQLYEGALDILAVPILLWLVRRRPADGVVAWVWFTYYGITRSIAEIWREPGFTVLGIFSGGQLVAIPTIFIGAYLLYRALRAGKRTDARPPLENAPAP